jgi:hypothetical protein
MQGLLRAVCSNPLFVRLSWDRRLITSFIDIPTVDVSALVTNGPKKEQQKAGDQLHTACVEVGFFYIKNHGMVHCYNSHGELNARSQSGLACL